MVFPRFIWLRVKPALVYCGFLVIAVEYCCRGFSMQKTKRIGWIDSVKALAIFLVVMGHFLDAPSVIRTYIYTFHMHLFFFVSGFVFRKKGSFLTFVRKRAWALIVPYFIFSLLKYVYTILKYHFGRSTGIHENTLQRFYDIFLWHHYFWFLGVLFVVSITFFPIAEKMHTVKNLLILVLIGTLSHYILSTYCIGFVHENMRKCFIAIVFYAFGYFFKDKISSETLYKVVEKHVGLFFAFVVVNITTFFYFYKQYGQASFNFSHNYLFYYLLAISGIVLSLTACQLIRENKIFSFVGANTIIIYLMEPYPQAVFGRFIRTVFHVDNLGNATFGYSIIYSLLTIIILVPFIVVINRYVPFVIGRRKKYPVLIE